MNDGTEQTILLIESAGRGVDWKEPRDLTFSEAVNLLTIPIRPPGSDGPIRDEGYFYKPQVVRNVAMCDESCRRLRTPIPRETAVALLTANGGEKIDFAEIERLGEPELDYGGIYTFTLFVVLALVPGIPRLRVCVACNREGASSPDQAWSGLEPLSRLFSAHFTSSIRSSATKLHLAVSSSTSMMFTGVPAW
ncbi:MAG: hypothetical protein ACR2NU_03400 [Aeoliella sp.]